MLKIWSCELCNLEPFTLDLIPLQMLPLPLARLVIVLPAILIGFRQAGGFEMPTQVLLQNERSTTGIILLHRPQEPAHSRLAFSHPPPPSLYLHRHLHE